MSRRPAALAALLMLLAGCVPATPPVPPAAAVVPPAGWRDAAPGALPIDAAWWQKFGDPLLSKLVETALANNTDLAVAAARVREARAAETLARAQLFPTLGAGVGAREAREVSPFGQPERDFAAQPIFQAAYEVDLSGRIASQIEAARQNVAASEAARDAAALSVASATASGYITLLGLDARLKVVRETIESRGEALRIARDRARAGYTSQLEFRQAEVEYEGSAQLLPQAELAIRRQEDALSQLIGESPRAIDRGVTLGDLARPPIPAGLPSDLLRRRPDIAQAEYGLAASDASLAAARAQFLPTVQLTGSAGLAISSLLDDPITVWQVGGSILAPIFQGGRLRAGFDAAAARRDQTAFAYRRVALTAFREVEDSLAAVEKIAQQRARLEAQRDAAAETLRHARNRYRAGYSPYLDQLDAQRVLLAVELQLVQAESDQLNAYVALYQAMGGGWGPSAS